MMAMMRKIKGVGTRVARSTTTPTASAPRKFEEQSLTLLPNFWGDGAVLSIFCQYEDYFLSPEYTRMQDFALRISKQFLGIIPVQDLSLIHI